ncbi:MAG: RidA family protein [Gemmatimonadota bacterium]|nr:RidA family protein [Gemmatimonadota bacterium]
MNLAFASPRWSRHVARLAVAATLAVLVLGCRESGEAEEGEEHAAAEADTAQYLTPYGPPTRPFSPAVRVGDLIFLSGQVGADAAASGGLVAGGIEAETRQALDNIKQVLTDIGSSMDHVVKCTVMMADMKEWDRMNAIYTTYFAPGRLPARSAFGANGLALGARVEIECVASA